MNNCVIFKNAQYSKLSYNDIENMALANNLWFISNKQTDVQYYLFTTNRTLHIVFRGSDSSKDMISNVRFCKKSVPYNNANSKIRVHTGFLWRYKSDSVRSLIHKFITADIDKIEISGHSYGAALATLCATDLQYNFPQKEYTTILFGSPRVGNNFFKKSYNKRVPNTIRVENGNDLVTKIPFLFLGYQHIGKKYHIGSRSIPFKFSLEDHNIQNYIENLPSKYIFNF